MSTVVIRIDGTDVTDDVIIRGASFASQVNGAIGQATLRVKDINQTYEFASGGLLTLDIDSVRVWGGYVMAAKKVYALPVIDTTSPSAVTRMWEISGADHNILFNKRIVFKESDPTGKINFSYDADVYDDTIINDIFDNYLDIAADGLTRTGVTRIAKAILDLPGKTHRGLVASAGFTWKQMMDSVQRATGGVYYLDASRDLKYVDVETSTSDYTLTDQPAGGFDVGYQGFTLLEDGSRLVNDMFVWGAGTGSANMVFSRSQDSSSIAEHGRWQLSLVTSGLFRQASADIVSASYVYGTPQSHRGGKDDAIAFNARVFEPRFAAGDVVDVVCGTFDFADAIPIRNMVTTFASPTDPIFDLTITHAIDEPLGISEWALPGLGGFPPWPPLEGWHPPPPPEAPTVCLWASCISDDFNRTVAPPHWDLPWTTIADSAAGGGISGGVANIVDVATWNVTRSTTLLQQEVGNRKLDLIPCFDNDAPWEYFVAWTADARFNSFEVYSTTGTPPPGTVFFPGALYEFDPTILTTVSQQFLEFWFVSGHYVSSGPNNPTLLRIGMDSTGSSVWTLGNVGLSTTFNTPTAFSFSAGSTYKIRVQVDADGQTRAKMWDDAGAEPIGWPVTRITTGGTALTNRPTGFHAAFVRGIAAGSLSPTPANNDFTFLAVKVDMGCFDAEVGVDTPDIPTVPNLGLVSETIIHSGGTDFVTSKAFFSGSLEVWVNGTQQTSFTFDAAAGTFSLSPSIDVTDFLYVSYQANGDPV